jgi:predicted membrane-bound spermidine synthase
MQADGSMRLARLLAVFALSGFAGLIYQSIWSHYLGLTLGHAAYAQTLVLAIYMGGLALGSWLASRMVSAIDNPVLTYAKVELAIGVLGLVFPRFFAAYTHVSYDMVLPQLAGSGVHLYQWGSAALLILPQCILLGMTFPLLAAGCLRMQRDEQSRSLGGLYFTNSAGAAVGALAATFVLLPSIGMPGAMIVAGLINVVVAMLAWAMSRSPATLRESTGSVEKTQRFNAKAGNAIGSARMLRGILAAAAITGATSFVYEIVWVRMLNLAFGTTMHSFELMLSTFILGLAAGGYWIHRRGDLSGNTLRFVGITQVMMGISALASTLVCSQSFRWISWMVLNLPRTDNGYALYNMGCTAIALLVMFPAAFFAGTTLPLFTVSLLRKGEGDRSVGRVYAANTVGAILGVMMTVHLLIPVVGLHLSLLAAAVADVTLGVVIILYSGSAMRKRDTKVSALAASAMLACALLFGRADPIAQSSGVFRTGVLFGPEAVRLAYLADGKTSTVSVLRSVNGAEAAIATNGKPDAGLTLSLDQKPLGDEATMIMAAALPLAMHPAPRQVAVIGWGSGLTTHSMLGSDQVRGVDTVEIEPAMYEGAKSFGARVERAYADPRSHVIFDDARTYFAAGRKQYDVIFSEPSNPWVNGVASLFTEEFYEFVRGHLNRGGLFVQWLQSYEISDSLQARIVAALLKKFPDSEVYLTNDTDLILLASIDPRGALKFDRLTGLPLTPELVRIGLGNATAFRIRRIGGPEILKAYTRMQGAKGHSDYYPVVALEAPKSRFLHDGADLLPSLVTNGMPILDMIDGREPVRRNELDPKDGTSSFTQFEMYAGAVVDAFNSAEALQALRSKAPDEARELTALLAMSKQPLVPEQLPEWSSHLAAVARFSTGALAAEDLTAIWIEPKWLAPGQLPEVEAVMTAYRAAAQRDAKAMRERAEAVLALDRSGLSDSLREQMLVIAMAGAAGQRNYASMRALDARFAPTLRDAHDFADVRRFLLAWADR